MTWQLINVEPQFGICDSCHRHDCGIVDGQHKWIVTGIEDKYGDRQVIGYDCVKMWADNMGITREVVIQGVVRPPTHDEIAAYIKRAMEGVTDDASAQPADVDARPDVAPLGQQTGDSAPTQPGTGKRTNNAHRAAVRKPRNVRKSEA